jgi:tetratricopeptide (TPR) repeat protein
MKMILVLLITLLALNTLAQCQQTAEDWYDKGKSLSYQAEYDEAVKAYEETIRLDPNYVRAWGSKGDDLNALGKHDEAVKAYEKFFKLRSSVVDPIQAKGTREDPIQMGTNVNLGNGWWIWS